MHTPFPRGLLTAEDERTLAREIEAGVLAEHLLATGERPVAATDEELQLVAAAGRRAWEHFLASNLRLVWKLAGREARVSGLGVPELFQEGFVALAGALQRYDPDRGRFSTFATIRVCQHLAEVGASRFGAALLPPSRAVRVRRARGLEAALGQQQGRAAGTAEVAAALGQPAERARELLGYRAPVALDALAEGAELAETDPRDPDADIWAAQLRRLLRRLDRDEAHVVALRHGLLTGEPVEVDVVAALLGRSASTVRRLERRGLAALRPAARSFRDGDADASPHGVGRTRAR